MAVEVRKGHVSYGMVLFGMVWQSRCGNAGLVLAVFGWARQTWSGATRSALLRQRGAPYGRAVMVGLGTVRPSGVSSAYGLAVGVSQGLMW